MSSNTGSTASQPSTVSVVRIDPKSGLTQHIYVLLPISVVDPKSGLVWMMTIRTLDHDLLARYVEDEYDRRALEAYRTALIELIRATVDLELIIATIRNLIISLAVYVLSVSALDYVQSGPTAI